MRWGVSWAIAAIACSTTPVDTKPDATVDGGGDAGCGSGCASGLVCCADRCVDLATDNANCGSCGSTCGGATPFCDVSCKAIPCTRDISMACSLLAGSVCCGKVCCSTDELCCKSAHSSATMCFAPTQQSPSCPYFEGPPDDASAPDVVDAAQVVDASDAGNVTTLVSGLDDATAIVLDATTVYWTSKYRFAESCAKTGCNNTPTVIALSQGSNTATALAVDSTYAYIANTFTQAVQRCAIGGCTLPTTLAPSGVSVVAFALDGTTLDWPDLTAGTISSCDTGGCGNVATVIGTGPIFPHGLGFDATDIYWTVSTEILKCPKSGCSGSPSIVTSTQNAYGIVVDTAALFWTTGSDVMTCTKSSCTPSSLASNQVGASSIVMDATYVYWANTLGGQIMKCAKAGCGGNPTVIASGQTDLRNLAVDSTSAYWTVGTAVLYAPLN